MKADDKRYFPMATAAECPASTRWPVVSIFDFEQVLLASGGGVVGAVSMEHVSDVSDLEDSRYI